MFALSGLMISRFYQERFEQTMTLTVSCPLTWGPTWDSPPWGLGGTRSE